MRWCRLIAGLILLAFATTVSAQIIPAGFGDFANRKAVQVVRKTPTGNKILTINMVNVLEKGKTEEDVTLEPDDLVMVPQRGINF